MSSLHVLIELLKRYEITGEPEIEKDIDKLKSEINTALKIQKEIIYRSKYPMAMNYLQFEEWAKGLLKL